MKLCVSPQCPVVNGTGVARELDDDADVCDGCGADQPPVAPVAPVVAPAAPVAPVVAPVAPVVAPAAPVAPVVAPVAPVVAPAAPVAPVVAPVAPVVAPAAPVAPVVAPAVPWYKRYSLSTWAWIAVGILVILVVLYFGIKGVVSAGEHVVGGPDPSHDPERPVDPHRDPERNPDPPRRDPERPVDPPFNPGSIGRPGLPAIAGQCDPGLTRVEYDPTSGASDPSADPVCGYGGLITEPAEKEGQLYYCCRR